LQRERPPDYAHSATIEERAQGSQGVATGRQARDRLEIDAVDIRIAQIKAEVENANWELSQTTISFPATVV
jgi:multidrug resistance efflux pump